MDFASFLFPSRTPHRPFLLLPPKSLHRPFAAPRAALTVGDALAALDTGATLDAPTYTRLLQSCIDSHSISDGRRLHARLSSVRDPDAFVHTKLVSMYAKCGSLDEARKVFDETPHRNIFTWSAMISGCAREERWEEVLVLFRAMTLESVIPDAYLLPKILQACANLEDLATGRLLHSIAIRSGALFNQDDEMYVDNSIVGMYAKCGELALARLFLSRMERSSVIAWNSVITGCCQHGKSREAMRIFHEMQARGVHPSLITWNILINCFNESGDLNRSMEMLRQMQGLGLSPDVITWTSMICGFTRGNRFVEALEFLREMLLAGKKPNGMTLAGALSACAALKTLGKGLEVHSLSIRLGCLNTVLVGNALIDFYGKCERVGDAEKIFTGMPERDVCTWNSMIGCYTQSRYFGKAHDMFHKMESLGISRSVVTWNAMIFSYLQYGDVDRAVDLFQRMVSEGVKRSTSTWNLLIAGSLRNHNPNRALQVFRQMQFQCEKPNKITILCILAACANLVSAWKVKEIHACVLRRELNLDVSVSNALINSYAKSGDLSSSQLLFDHHSSRDLITWNSLMSGYILHKLPAAALNIYHRMEQEKVQPDQITCGILVSAYGLLGMVDEARVLFSSMIEKYGVSLVQEHYAAMVDALGRSGNLSEAMHLIQKMPSEPGSVVWLSLFRASRINGDTERANYAAEQLMKLEPWNFVAQCLFIQTEELCKYTDASKLLTKLQNAWRSEMNPGSSCLLDHSNRVLIFTAGDRSFSNSELVYSKVSALEEEIKEKQIKMVQNGYLEVEDEISETVTGMHSEKLAIAFALINPPACGNIRIVKNLRTCSKCHTAAKYISSAYKCEIILKDPKCMHHIKDGMCSCDDYW